MERLESLLLEDMKALGLALPEAAPPALVRYLDMVLETNKTMNLTSITEPEEAVHKHLVDSLSALLLKDLAAQAANHAEAASAAKADGPLWIDVGSGAGFPGFPLALAVPKAALHLVESTGKKAHFLNTAAAQLGLLKQIEVHNSRAETLAPLAPGPRSAKAVSRETSPAKNLRGLADAVFFRGVSRLAALAELGAPLLKLGGLIIAYKGPKSAEELVEAAKAMKELKIELAERKDFVLPGTSDARVLLCLKKVGETPKRFPRLVGLAQKEPLI